MQLKSNSNIFFRIGFFLLGSFLISTIISAFGLILFPLISENYQVIFFFYAIVAYIGLEVLVNMKFFRHGLDCRAHLVIGLGIAAVGIAGAIDLTRDVAQDNGLTVDEAGFSTTLAEAKERAKVEGKNAATMISTAPRIKPPIMAPRTLPIPPTTAQINAFQPTMMPM